MWRGNELELCEACVGVEEREGRASSNNAAEAGPGVGLLAVIVLSVERGEKRVDGERDKVDVESLEKMSDFEDRERS